ncbi:MAG: hypothetical protein GTO30_18915 [Acidobacteria bacterium]|nr:hypothetical protein [Acidobacteriota bacterium]NIM63635.1 hypothetical protein [Acidobacteriota bacterium]NIQ85160.1 hypothetical protein [Acidobacteriota bacterium]NIT10915.1 hypothetical protein [Acidobacteriota bacterium]
MWVSFLVAAVLLSLILALWVAVQLGWRRVFDHAGPDPDVLVGRMGCGGCDHHEKKS